MLWKVKPCKTKTNLWGSGIRQESESDGRGEAGATTNTNQSGCSVKGNPIQLKTMLIRQIEKEKVFKDTKIKNWIKLTFICKQREFSNESTLSPSCYFTAAIEPNGKHSQKVKSSVKWEGGGAGKDDGARDKVYFVLNSSLILSVVGTCQFCPSE